MTSRMMEFKAGKLIAQLHVKSSIPGNKALDYLQTTDERLGEIIHFIHENNHIFYNPTNTEGLVITSDMQLMVTSDPETKKEVLKGLKKQIKELKAAIKGAYHG